MGGGSLLKRALCILAAALLIISQLPLSLSASPADTVVENLSAFNEHFSVSTGNINSAFEDAFAAKPELVFYYYGMSYTVYGSHTDCDVQYANTDIPINSIHVADSSEDLYSCIRTAMMKAETDVYIVFSDGKNLIPDFSGLVEQVRDRDYIAYMGYKSVSVKIFSNNHSDAAAYKINFTYGYDSETLVQMKKETKDEVVRLTTEVFAPGMSEYMLVKSIHDYLIDHARYEEKSNLQLVYYAYGPLIKGIGVCEGYTEAARLLFNAVGIESVFVSGTVVANIPHAWNLVKLGGNWYQLDITWDDPVSSDGKNNKTYDYFNITDSEMAVDHVWSGDYPKCTVKDRGINATQAAMRPQSQAESIISVVQTSSQARLPSSQTVSSKQSVPAASSKSSVRTSEETSIPTPSSSVFSSAPVLPVISTADSLPSSQPTNFQLSRYISAVSHELGISVQLTTILMILLVTAVVLIIGSLIFRKRT